MKDLPTVLYQEDLVWRSLSLNRRGYVYNIRYSQIIPVLIREAILKVGLKRQLVPDRQLPGYHEAEGGGAAILQEH
jgi:hypothetical protein